MKPSYDSNHSEIKARIQKLGAVILLDLASYSGPWDLLVGFRGKTFWIEIKTPEALKKAKTSFRSLTKNEKELLKRLTLAKVPGYVVQDCQEVERVLFQEDKSLVAIPEFLKIGRD